MSRHCLSVLLLAASLSTAVIPVILGQAFLWRPMKTLLCLHLALTITIVASPIHINMIAF